MVRARELEGPSRGSVAPGREVPQHRFRRERGPLPDQAKARSLDTDIALDKWLTIPGAPGMMARANSKSGMLEVDRGAVMENFPTKSDVQLFCTDFGLSPTQTRWLEAMNMEARRAQINGSRNDLERVTPNEPAPQREARDASPSETRPQLNIEEERLKMERNSRDDRLTNGNSQHPPAERRAAARNGEQQGEQAPHVGRDMEKSDWRQAIEVIKAKDNVQSANIYRAREDGSYSGRYLGMTDTHILLSSSRGKATMHDWGKLDNSLDTLNKAENGSLKDKYLTVQYTGDRGVVSERNFDREKLDSLKKDQLEWGQKNLPAGRLKEWEKTLNQFIAAKGKEQDGKTPANGPGDAARDARAAEMKVRTDPKATPDQKVVAKEDRKAAEQGR